MPRRCFDYTDCTVGIRLRTRWGYDHEWRLNKNLEGRLAVLSQGIFLVFLRSDWEIKKNRRVESRKPG